MRLLFLSSVIVLVVLSRHHQNRRHISLLSSDSLILKSPRLVVVPNLNDDSNPGTYVVIRGNLHRLSTGTQQIALVLWQRRLTVYKSSLHSTRCLHSSRLSDSFWAKREEQ